MPTLPRNGTARQVEILIIDGDRASRLLMIEGFRRAGMTSDLRSVEDGADALAYLRNEGEYKNVPVPDLIFMDLSLRKIHGLEVLKAIKATPHLRHIPIVVSSGTDNPEEIRAVYALNGNCFMRKPAELVEFLRFIESCYQFWGTVVTLSPPQLPTE